MTDLLKKFIEDNINLIEQSKFDELFDKANTYNICSELTQVLVNCDVDFLNSISKIYKYMFTNTDIKDIVLPNNITGIEVCGFWQCTSLENITIPQSVTYIRGSAFQDCHKLTNVTIPEGVIAIQTFTFHRCKNLTSVDLPSTIQSIGEHSFNDCSKLASLVLPEGLRYIHVGAFAKCSELKKLVLPSTLLEIDDTVFYGAGLSVIDFNGTKAQWTRVKKARNWRSGQYLTVVCSDGKISYNY